MSGTPNSDLGLCKLALWLGGTVTADIISSYNSGKNPESATRLARYHLRRLAQRGLFAASAPRPANLRRRPTLHYRLTPQAAELLGMSRTARPFRSADDKTLLWQSRRATAMVSLLKAGWGASVSARKKLEWLSSRCDYLAAAHNAPLLRQYEERVRLHRERPDRFEMPAHPDLASASFLMSYVPMKRLNAGHEQDFTLVMPGILAHRRDEPSRPLLYVRVAVDGVHAATEVRHLGPFAMMAGINIVEIALAVPDATALAAWLAFAKDVRAEASRPNARLDKIPMLPRYAIDLSAGCAELTAL